MTTDQKLALLRATVQAKMDYFDALLALEVAIAPDGEFSDVANNEVIFEIDLLASGGLDASGIAEEHLATIVKAAQR